MYGWALLKLTVVYIFFASNTLACTYSDYLLTVDKDPADFNIVLPASEQTGDALEGYVIEAAYPICDLEGQTNFVHLFVVDGAVRLVGNSIRFQALSDAEAYYSEILARLLSIYDLEGSSTIPGDGGTVSERHSRLIKASSGVILDIGMVTEYDFDEYSVYIESYIGRRHPLMEERQ